MCWQAALAKGREGRVLRVGGFGGGVGKGSKSLLLSRSLSQLSTKPSYLLTIIARAHQHIHMGQALFSISLQTVA